MQSLFNAFFDFHTEGRQGIEEINYLAFFVDFNWVVMLSLALSKLESTQTNYFEDSRTLLQYEILCRYQILFLYIYIYIYIYMYI